MHTITINDMNNDMEYVIHEDNYMDILDSFGSIMGELQVENHENAVDYSHDFINLEPENDDEFKETMTELVGLYDNITIEFS